MLRKYFAYSLIFVLSIMIQNSEAGRLKINSDDFGTFHVYIGRDKTVGELKKHIQARKGVPEDLQAIEVNFGNNTTVTKDDNDPITSFFDKGATVSLNVIK